MYKNEVRDAFRVHYKWTVLEYSQAEIFGCQAQRLFNYCTGEFYDF